jgi:O-antigen ligase
MGWLIAYSSYAAASCAWSPYLLVAAVRAAELLVVLLLAWTAYRAAERDHFHRLAHGFLLLTTASIVLGLLVHLPQPKIQAGRFTWLAVHPTSSSVFLGISIVLLAVYLAEGAHAKGSPRWGHAWYALLLPVHLVALYVNHTRGTVAAVLVAVVVMGAQVYPRRRRVTFLVGLVWMAAFVVVTAGGALVAYVERGSTVGNLLTLNTRTNLWSVAFVAVERQPLFGSGLYASRGIFYDQTGLGGGHNAIVNVLVELGMVGTCLWLALIGATVLPLWRLRRLCSAPEVATDRLLLISVLAMLAVNGVTVAGIGGVANLSAIWLFLIVGWAAQLARRPVPPADPDENRRSTEERSS